MTKRTVAILASAAILLLGLSMSPALAASPDALATVSGKACTDRGVTNYYVHHWQHLPAWKILRSTMRFREHRCATPNHFRLYKSTSDTAHEVKFARRFERVAATRESYPSVFCQADASHAYFLDLAFLWGMGHIHHLNLAERNHYATWAHNYAERHGCQVFEPGRS